ncbi:MAG: DoxX family protein [Planctomycetes bacterium]|nr:DoxX family protein [Planctomycetota bacterium]
MFWTALVARLILGGMFVVFSVNALLPSPFIHLPPPDSDVAKTFMKTLYIDSNYLRAVKVLELIGGLLVLSGRLVPLGLVILTPIAVNILFYEFFLVGQAGPGVPLVILCATLIWVYRSHFTSLFAIKPKIG